MVLPVGNMSPLQLFVEGVCESGQYEDPPQQSDSALSGPSPNLTAEQVEVVEVPANKFVPCIQLFTQLQSSVDPMSQCRDFGKDFYYQSIRLVGQHLQAGCSNCQVE